MDRIQKKCLLLDRKNNVINNSSQILVIYYTEI